MNRRIAVAVLLCAAICASIAACDAGQITKSVSIAGIGNARHGKQLIRSYGCGACHMIPGIGDARGKVGPPLFYLSDRTMIAGEIPNTPENLTHWIEHPRDVEPKTAMPELGVTPSDAYDIAAYLYTLKGPEGTSWID
ncbi:MAG: c-type cytochrome [Terracidiphilus sp.]